VLGLYLFQQQVLRSAEHHTSSLIWLLVLRCRVTCSEAAGRVSAELLCPYPPGVPVAIPGELLQEQTIQQLLSVLKAGGTVTGPSDPTLSTFLVVAD